VAATTHLLQIALDVLLAVLVVLVGVSAARAAHDEPGVGGVVGLVGVLALAGVYVAGRAAVPWRTDDVDAPRGAWWPSGAWVTLLVVLWAGTLVVVDSALWLAFVLFFLEMHVLGPRRGPVAVAVTTALAVSGALHHGLSTIGSVVGPVLGAAVSVGVVLGLEAVVRESQARLAVIEELRRTRADLADAESDRVRAQERERLAREIHDTLAQGFSSIGLLLRAADRSMTDGDLPAARGHLAVAQEAVGENLAEARRVVRALAPPALDSANLVGALERLAARTCAESGLDVTVVVSGEARELPAPVETALLRISQSALANVVQHAHAGQARLTVTFHDDAVALDVVDDGVGFDPARAAEHHDRGPSSGGFGLVAMRSRVAELGGTLVVESAPRSPRSHEHADPREAGVGTALAVQVPLAVPGHDAAPAHDTAPAQEER